jgi:hypothetical protein
MSWDKRQLEAVAMIRKEVPGARVRFFGGGSNWTYEADGPEVIAIDYTDQHLGAPPYLSAIHWATSGIEGWLSDDDLPPPPVLPASQMRHNIYTCTNVDFSIEQDRLERSWTSSPT